MEISMGCGVPIHSSEQNFWLWLLLQTADSWGSYQGSCLLPGDTTATPTTGIAYKDICGGSQAVLTAPIIEQYTQAGPTHPLELHVMQLQCYIMQE